MKKIEYCFFLAALVTMNACDLNESPTTEADKAAVFSSVDGMKAYTMSFYDYLPSANEIQQSDATLTDYFATSSLNQFVRKGAYNESTQTSWDWTALRNINYFIENIEQSSESESTRNNYLGIARFFRAYFYYDKVKTYGDVPWIEKALDVDDPQLYAPRDSRETVMENVWQDLQFAEANISQAKESTCSYVTRWAAYALASRLALFEGTYRKYHGLSLATSADTWLTRAAESSKAVMDNGGYSLYTADGEQSFRNLFTSDAPKASEMILAVCSSASLNSYHQANWQWTTASYGYCPNFVREFVNTFLQKDGKPYTDKAGYETDDFYTECQNRDARLAAEMRTPGYMREGSLALPDLGGYARTGYQPMKFSVDSKAGDNTARNTNALPIFRYAEVLLNYAEAKAELGQLTDADWAATIGKLRARAGITGGLNSKPITMDTYMHTHYFPSIKDPSLLEIRRERGIEMCFEGLRFDDLRRWNAGDLLLKQWRGMNISAVNTPLDIDHNGTPDVIYYTSEDGLATAKSLIDWDTYKSTCATVPVTTNLTAKGGLKVISNGLGYQLVWDSEEDADRVFGKKQYLYPIPNMVMVRNDNITQNPGWEDGASNDGN